MARSALIFLGLMIMMVPFAASAATDQTPIEIRKAEQYFDTLKTAKARFVQTASNGAQQRGTFYLSRPGKLRFEYDSPNKDFIVADGLFIYFYDAQLKQQSNAPISQTLADFLLRKDFSLSGDLKVTRIMHAGDLTQISIVQRDDPESGTLVLGFTVDKNKDYHLKKWRIVDAMGNITETELFDVHTGMKFKNSKQLFSYIDPERKGYNN